MKSARSILVLAFAGLVLTAAASLDPARSHDQSDDGLLNRRARVERQDSIPTSIAFLRLISGLPGGLVLIPDRLEETRLDFPSSGETLRDVLDSLVATDPEYRWRVVGGVINLTPIAYETPLLDTQIAEFKVEKETVVEALDKLLSAPEVKSRAATLGLTRCQSILVGLSGSQWSEDRFSLSREGATLRENLNAIVHAQGHAVWCYREIYVPEERRRYYRIEYLAR